MRVVLQRVKQGGVSVEGRKVAVIGAGLVLLVGIGPGDNEARMKAMAEKIAFLRVFEDDQGKMNRSILEAGGAVIVISQFTLYADTRKGRRPSFTGAAAPELARPLVDRFAAFLAEQGLRVQSGEFGADMLVEIHNDGPVTILLEMDD
jgi:D-tyrosyl-tRNA(Tyr) deacylase